MEKRNLTGHWINKILGEVRLLHIPLDIVIAGVFTLGGHKFLSGLGVLDGEVSLPVLVLCLIVLAVALLPAVVRIFDVRVEDKAYVGDVWQRFRRISIPALTFCFMCFVYLPSETFIGNNSDFEFSYQMFIPHQLVVMAECFLVAAVCISICNRPSFEMAEALVFGLNLAVYIQYMFLNARLNLLDGSSPVWSDYQADIAAGYLIWGVLLIAPIIFMRKSKKIWERIRLWGPAFLGGIQLVTLCSLLFTAPAEIFRVKLQGSYMSPEEQFRVSAKDNVILLIWDAVDNAYLKELIETEPEEFEGLEDFVIYTNTCSVFDATATSVAQMLAGMEFAVELPGKEWHEQAWNSERAVEFFERWHEAGYVINGFNLETSTVENYEGKFDNYRIAGDEESERLLVDEERMYEKLSDLIAYRALPMGWKRLVDSANLDFAGIVTRRERTYYDNREYMEHLQLATGEKEQNYLVVEHLQGTHDPCPDTLEETRFLLEMLKEYIWQLKELGVYDDAAVIVTSDHGEHNVYDPTKASTPILMVKEKGKHNEELVLRNAPVYHEDMQATLLDCAGLYDKERDEALFGRSVFEIKEDMLRERTWYNKREDPNYPRVTIMGRTGILTKYNTYYSYTYTGDTGTLEQMVREGRCTRIYPMTDYKG
ncbi:MAG: hypothetical protein K2O32_10110 [Acetatifactor sp.]|nr:hypothetical protein [Acetatifactor sp.]